MRILRPNLKPVLRSVLRPGLALGVGLIAAVTVMPPLAHAGGGVGFTLTASLEGAGRPFDFGSKHKVLITLADIGEASLRDITLSVRDVGDADPEEPVACAGGSAGAARTRSLEPGQTLDCLSGITATPGRHTVTVTAQVFVPGEPHPRIRTRALDYFGLPAPAPRTQRHPPTSTNHPTTSTHHFTTSTNPPSLTGEAPVQIGDEAATVTPPLAQSLPPLVDPPSGFTDVVRSGATVVDPPTTSTGVALPVSVPADPPSGSGVMVPADPAVANLPIRLGGPGKSATVVADPPTGTGKLVPAGSAAADPSSSRAVLDPPILVVATFPPHAADRDRHRAADLPFAGTSAPELALLGVLGLILGAALVIAVRRRAGIPADPTE